MHLETVEQERKNQLMAKDQELKDMVANYEHEIARFKEIIEIKDKMIENLTTENHKEKARNLALTKDY